MCVNKIYASDAAAILEWLLMGREAEQGWGIVIRYLKTKYTLLFLTSI